MKFSLTFLFIAVISFSFVEKESNILKGSVYGIWQGAYGDSSMIENLVIDVKPDNKMDLYKNDVAKHKITGTYIIKGDTAIIFSYKNEDGCNEVLMYGNLNKTMNFVDGVGRLIFTQKEVFIFKNKLSRF